jgi:SPP1 gp7 family putative phage head morphogenesis protein
MPPQLVELRPIRERISDYDRIERRIRAAFKSLIYAPLVHALGLPRQTVQNATWTALTAAVAAGRLTYRDGSFRGKFDAAASKELRELGAKWDRRTASYRLDESSIPYQTREAINASAQKFQDRLVQIDNKLAQVVPAEIAEAVNVADLFDSVLFKVDSEFEQSVKKITVAPKLPASQRRRIADEWQNNMELWIKNFTADEIVRLRKSIADSAAAGNRYEATIRAIQESYGVTARKAKFLARQETSLLMTKFKQVRYQAAGVNEYRWACVAGSPKHPVRPSHRALNGKIFRWDAPPITTGPGEPVRRNNPGQDYNCRCAAIPLVRFKES